MKVLVSHPTGNRNVRAVLQALHGHKALAAFYTAMALGREPTWPRFLPATLRKELDRRRYDLPHALVKAHPARELARLLSMRAGIKRIVAHETGWASVDRVYAGVDARAAAALHPGLDAVYAYEDGALATFRRARALGIPCVYDLPIAYWETLRSLLREEAERLPAWAATIGGGLTDSEAKLERKSRELELADLVVTPGRFVADSLPAWAKNKQVVMSPFGSPAPISEAMADASKRERLGRARRGEPLRVLFAGSMGQRKGLGDLMAAVRLLGRSDVELVVMGSLQCERAFYERECPGFRYEPGRPHAQVLELMRSCDVFCLPSIVEGRALVMQEAMSQGLPLIITPNTGGQDLVEESVAGGGDEERRRADSEDRASDIRHPASSVLSPANPPLGLRPPLYGRSLTGFLVPIRSPEGLATKITWCADNREALVEMGDAARATAACYTWGAYGQNVVAAILSLVSTPGSFNG